MRISDWSSDVCSSDLDFIGLTLLFAAYGMQPMAALALTAVLYHVASHALFKSLLFVGTGSVLHATAERSLGKQIGRASCRERVCQYVEISVVAVSLKKKKKKII